MTATMRKGKGYRLIWRGDEVVEAKVKQTGAALSEIGLRVEGEAKKELYKGHGVLTGTLRRSIHCARPGYAWTGDNVPATSSSPERGGQMVLPGFDRHGAIIQVGSGLEYAMAVHQGHHSFEGYHYLRNGLGRVKPLVSGIVRKHAGR